MRNSHVQLIVLTAISLLIIALSGSNFPSGVLYAQTDGTGVNPSGPAISHEDSPSSPTIQPGVGNDGGGAQPGTSSRLGNEPQRAGVPWGAVILSFLAGLIVGSLVFRGRTRHVVRDDRDIRDDDDFRRAA